jgi:hypothetical protein
MPDLDAAKVTYTANPEPLSRDTFLFTIDGYQDELTFIRDSAGAPAYIRNRAFVAAKSAAFAPHAVDVDRLRARLHDAEHVRIPRLR